MNRKKYYHRSIMRKSKPQKSVLPSRPEGFKAICHFEGFDDNKPEGLVYVCNVGWAWGPAHSRNGYYYINSEDGEWVLWLSWPDEGRPYDEYDNPRYLWSPFARAPKGDTDMKTAAVYLLVETWAYETKFENVDYFDFFDEGDLLSADDVRQTGIMVWPEMPEE